MKFDWKSYRLAATLVFMVLTVGPLGFVFLEDMSFFDGLYMTVITISTVGFREVRPLSDAGRWFVIFLIVGGLISASYIAREIGTRIVEGQLRNALGKRKMDARLKKLRGHTIVAGFGRVGQEVVREFCQTSRDVEFVIVDNQPETLESLADSDYLYVRGDITVDETLRQAGIENAATLVSTLPGDADNVYLALTARHLNPKIRIIARADHPEAERKLRRAGADDVVSPHSLGGWRMANLAVRPHLVHFFHALSTGEHGLGFEEVIVTDSSALAGKTLMELSLPMRENVAVIGIRKKESKFSLNPTGETQVEAGDVLLLIGEPERLLKLAGV